MRIAFDGLKCRLGKQSLSLRCAVRTSKGENQREREQKQNQSGPSRQWEVTRGVSEALRKRKEKETRDSDGCVSATN